MFGFDYVVVFFVEFDCICVFGMLMCVCYVKLIDWFGWYLVDIGVWMVYLVGWLMCDFVWLDGEFELCYLLFDVDVVL